MLIEMVLLQGTTTERSATRAREKLSSAYATRKPTLELFPFITSPRPSTSRPLTDTRANPRARRTRTCFCTT